MNYSNTLYISIISIIFSTFPAHAMDKQLTSEIAKIEGAKSRIKRNGEIEIEKSKIQHIPIFIIQNKINEKQTETFAGIKTRQFSIDSMNEFNKTSNADTPHT